MTDEVFNWDGSSNNRDRPRGRARSIRLTPYPRVPPRVRTLTLAARSDSSRLRTAPPADYGCYVTGVYVIWKFAENIDLAQQFLTDLAVASRQSFLKEPVLQQPPLLPGRCPRISARRGRERRRRASSTDKYGLLAHAAEWTKE